MLGLTGLPVLTNDQLLIWNLLWQRSFIALAPCSCRLGFVLLQCSFMARPAIFIQYSPYTGA